MSTTSALAIDQPAYMRAWSKMARNMPHTITADESRALQAVEQFRAMSLTDSAGGYLSAVTAILATQRPSTREGW